MRVTSRQLAQDLGLKEESVRRDLSFVGGVGRRGTGYEVDILFDALQAFLGLSEEYPIVKVGTAQMLEALDVVFPSSSYGVHPVACFSEITEDVGKSVHGVEVRHLSEIPQLDRELGVHVALVATSPEHVSPTLGLLAQAGITGVLLLTPLLSLDKPESMTVTQVHMPCDIKSLAYRVHGSGDRC